MKVIEKQEAGSEIAQLSGSYRETFQAFRWLGGCCDSSLLTGTGVQVT
jgi:hypothetical protein